MKLMERRWVKLSQLIGIIKSWFHSPPSLLDSLKVKDPTSSGIRKCILFISTTRSIQQSPYPSSPPQLAIPPTKPPPHIFSPSLHHTSPPTWRLHAISQIFRFRSLSPRPHYRLPISQLLVRKLAFVELRRFGTWRLGFRVGVRVACRWGSACLVFRRGSRGRCGWNRCNSVGWSV